MGREKLGEFRLGQGGFRRGLCMEEDSGLAVIG